MEFAFKDLKVWNKSIDFADHVISNIDHLYLEKRHNRIIEQLESASISVSNNIAEGKGRFSKKEFIHFLFIARGSLYETVSLLNFLYRRNWISKETLKELEIEAIEIVQMIKGLINSLSKS